ncbi:MAG: MFS transporter [Alphaproteobacteria bacterium]|nr:MFS transporter [Alphaproteobacteria bacterium]
MPLSAGAAKASAAAVAATAIGRYRWTICALLFFITTINYMDRQVIGVLKPVLQRELGWTEIDYGNIIFFFQLSYAAGYLTMGRFMDRVGVRLGLTLAVIGWSLATLAHGLIRTVVGFCAARFALGIAEGGNFPAAVKTISDWFPARDRAVATGVFNAGSNVGAMLTPLVVPWVTVTLGWPAAFYVMGLLGFVWLVFWLRIYRLPEQHPRLSTRELTYIRSDPVLPEEQVSWLSLLRYRGTWAFVTGAVMTAPVWWFYLFWVPDFLFRTHGLSLTKLGPPLIVIYILADIGSIGGGWVSGALIRSGADVIVAREIALLLCALLVVPIFLAPRVDSVWLATLLIGVAAAAHQGFSANNFTLVSDTLPRNAIASVVGIGGLAGGIGGMVAAEIVGHVLQYTGSYIPLFAWASCAYLVTVGIMHLILPRHLSGVRSFGSSRP